MNKKLIPYLLGITGSFILGLSLIFVKSGLDEAQPFVVLTYRFFFAFIIFSTLILFKIIKINLSGKPILPLIAIAIITPVIDLGAETTALKYITTVEAAIFLAFVPVLVMILSSIFLKEKSSLIQKIFVIISVIGAVVSAELLKNDASHSKQGLLLITIGIFGCATYSILARKFRKKYTPAEITYSMISIGFLAFFILATITRTESMHETFIAVLWKKKFISSFIYLSVGCSVLLFLIYNYMYSKISATTTSIFANLATLITILAGVIVLGENISVSQIIGGVLIITGVIGTNIIEYNKK